MLVYCLESLAQSYENQYRFILQTGLRTGELVGLKWKDIDLKSKTIQIRRSMAVSYTHLMDENWCETG